MLDDDSDDIYCDDEPQGPPPDMPSGSATHTDEAAITDIVTPPALIQTARDGSSQVEDTTNSTQDGPQLSSVMQAAKGKGVGRGSRARAVKPKTATEVGEASGGSLPVPQRVTRSRRGVAAAGKKP